MLHMRFSHDLVLSAPCFIPILHYCPWVWSLPSSICLETKLLVSYWRKTDSHEAPAWIRRGDLVSPNTLCIIFQPIILLSFHITSLLCAVSVPPSSELQVLPDCGGCLSLLFSLCRQLCYKFLFSAESNYPFPSTFYFLKIYRDLLSAVVSSPIFLVPVG